MSHDPTLYKDEGGYWVECSCGWLGDVQGSIYQASVRWQFHTVVVYQDAMRAAIAAGPKSAVDW